MDKKISGGGALLLVIAVLVGCGGGGGVGQEEEEWLSEVVTTVKGFQDGRGDADRSRIAAATNPRQLQGAYREYSAALTGLSLDIELTDPPEACYRLHNEMVRVVGELADSSGELGWPGRATISPHEKVVARQDQKAKRFVDAVRAIGNRETCSR